MIFLIQQKKEYSDIDFSTITVSCYKVLELQGDLIVELVFCSKADMQKLNKNTRNIDKPTDVLSFGFLNLLKDRDKFLPFNEKNYPLDYQHDVKAVFLGSIVICTDIAKNQAIEYDHSIVREISYLFTHGLLHLLGYDHELGKQQKLEMRKLEEEILKNV